jgi:hypothetical protein
MDLSPLMPQSKCFDCMFVIILTSQTQATMPSHGPVWIHELELVLASWSSTSHKVSKHAG